MNDEKITELEFKIPIEELFPKFKEHLEIKNNGRILFSGKFGIGKTYFLKNFFRANPEYEVFHLSPVNYQINSNEDISEFLKYDILIELSKKNKDIFQKNDYASLIDIQKLFFIWGKNNFTKIFKTGLSYIPRVGRSLSDTAGLIENFWAFKKEIEAGDKDFVENFLKKNKEKNPTETDYLSELLKEKILKEKNGKQSVLILDDLERIDPEHVFRILNIFSAHFGTQNEELPNKFGFDKVIIVADTKNLKSIFNHKYGEQTDFSGYIDKFFTIEIFQFKNEEVIAKAIDEIISHFRISDKEKNSLGEALGRDGFLRIILRDILLKSLELNGKEKLNLRQLFKGIKFDMLAFKNIKYNKDSFYGRDGIVPQLINISIKALISIFSGLDSDFINVLRRIKDNYDKERPTRAYDTFSYYLLKRIQPFKDEGNIINITWSQYQIIIENKRIKEMKFRSEIKEQNLYNLHFDLLIEYVSKNIYEKEIDHLDL